MHLISPEYAAQNRKLHEERDDYGRSSKMWADYVSNLVRDEGYRSVLDYGAGKGELKARLPRLGIREYDPAIPGKTRRPKPAELVVCTDVMEHIEPELLDNVLKDLKRVTERKLFFTVCTLRSSKTLPDGRNAHLIIQDQDWWRDKIGQHFGIIKAFMHLGVLMGEAFPLKVSSRAPAWHPPKARKRRTITPEWSMIFNQIREHSAKYQDAFSRIQTIEMFEDLPDDKPADLQAIVNMLPEVPNPVEMLQKAIKIARKGILVAHPLTAEKDEAYWRALLEKHLRIADWTCADGGMVCIGSPMVSVQGVTAIGVVDSDLRWEQVKAATAKIEKRIPVAPAHNKTAILACYGPSLRDNIDALREESETTPGSYVISVSGAHDFLLDKGILVDYHVECDPRPHKADNIEKAEKGTEYLIASVCHQAMFDKLAGGDIALWHVATPEHTLRLVDELGQSRDHVIGGGGSVGLRAIPLLYQMGFRKFSIYGMDCSFTDPDLPDDVQAEVDRLMATGDAAQMVRGQEIMAEHVTQWAGKHAGKRQQICQVDVGGRIFTSSPILMTYATNFFETIQKVADCQYRLVGNGLLQAMAHYYRELEKAAA